MPTRKRKLQDQYFLLLQDTLVYIRKAITVAINNNTIISQS